MHENVAGSNLRVRTGIDLVVVAEFRRSLERGWDAMRRRLFLPSEEAGAGIEGLAGIFAAKEAAFKALGLPLGDWHVLEIRRREDGRPYVQLSPGYDAAHIADMDLSISHSWGLAVATVVALLHR